MPHMRTTPSFLRSLILTGLIVLALAATNLPTLGAQRSADERLTPVLRSRVERAGLATVATTTLPADLSQNLAERRDGALLVAVQVRAATPATAQALAQVGLEVRGTASEFGRITGFIAPQRLPVLAALPHVLSISETYAPMALGGAAMLGGQSLAAAPANAPLTAACGLAIGAATTEGVAQMRVNLARALEVTGGTLDGSGITVGIISNSYNIGPQINPQIATTAETDIANGDLPGPGNPCGYTTPVQVLRELPNELFNLVSAAGVDETRAMAQIVHDIAPGARLIVASGIGANLSLDMAQVIRDLRAAGADIIVDDLAFQDQAIFQDDVISVAVDEVVADGAIYLTAAGNFNRTVTTANGPRDVTSYTTLRYRPIACPVLNFGGQPQTLPGDCHNFSPDPTVNDPMAGYTFGAGRFVQTRMQWAEPWYGVGTDFNFYWVDETTGEYLPNPFNPQQRAGSANNSLTTNIPLEGDAAALNTDNANPRTLSLIINRAAGSGTPAIWVWNNAQAGSLTGAEYLAPADPAASPDIFGNTSFGHRAARGAIAVGAAPYDDASVQEFSSRGGPLIVFGPITGNTPAAALARPELRQKPDVIASNGGANSFFGRAPNSANNATPFWRFYGTSAAAPHAAGVATLVLHQARASGIDLTPAELTNLLRETARPLNGFTARAQGAGLLDAFAAAQALRPSTAATLTISAPTTEEPASAGSLANPQPISVAVRVPLAGLSPNDFTVRIGAAEATVIAAVAISDTYRLEVLPPPQTTAGTYDLSVGLTVAGAPNAATATDGVRYGAELSNIAPRLSSYLNRQTYAAGDAIAIQAALFSTTPITGTPIMARVVLPAEAGAQLLPLEITLFDDGLHGDGAANDGVYGGMIAARLTDRLGSGALLIEPQLELSFNGRTGLLFNRHETDLSGNAAGPNIGAQITRIDGRTYIYYPLMGR